MIRTRPATTPHRRITDRRVTRRLMRLMLMWLLALVLPLQSTAVGVFAAQGPSHVHRVAAAPLLLEDVRRWKPAPAARPPLLAVLGHHHGDDRAMRHHHGPADTSVVASADDTGPGDEAPSGASLSVLALIPAFSVAAPGEPAAGAASRPGWCPQTGFIARLERPPRRG